MIYKNQNTMRKGILLIFTVLATLVGCGQYDDSELKSDINDLKSRMAALEKQCKNMNENLTSLQAIVDAIQKQDGIVSVTDLPDGQGYSVKFVSGKVIYLYNGKNGTDGVTPKISVRKDSDGIYYWTVDGDWLMVDGKKVRAVGLDGKDGKDGEDGQDGQDGKDAITPQLKIVEGFWYISYDNGKSWNKLGKATGENGKDGQDGKDGDGFFKSVTVKDGYAIFVMNDSEQTTLRIPVAVVSAVSSIKYVPESLDGIVKVRYSKIGGKNVPVDIVIMFEVMPQGAVDYIVKNWKEVLTAKAIYASSTKASIGDFVTMNIKDVVGGEDNIIVVTINAKSLDDLFFSTDIPVAANLRLAVKMNGSESISSDYLPLSPLLSYDQIIEYTTVTGDRIDYGSLFEFKRGDSALSLTDSHVGNAWRIYIEGSPVERNLFSCIFNKRSYDDNNGNYNYDLKSLSFVTPIELEALSFSESGSLILADLSNVNTENVIDMFRMFQGCYSLTSLDLSSLDTRNVTNMGRMFGVCSALTNLDLSGFDTRNVTNMSEMFFYCTSLASLGLSSFDTRNVTDMKRMFEECHSLTSLDLSSFYTRDVANMNRMFLNCKSLTSLDLSSFDTRNVTDMEFMFGGCSSLTSLDLSSFDARSVTNMYCMFSGCSALASLDLSSFDTKNVTDMSLMFKNCQSLTSLDLSSFDTKNVTDMNYMFSSCSSLVSLDLSGFDTKNVTGMYCMFYDCNSLTSLNLSNFSISENCLVSDMFHNCTNLKEIIMRGCDKTTIEMISKEKPEGAVIITD